MILEFPQQQATQAATATRSRHVTPEGYRQFERFLAEEDWSLLDNESKAELKLNLFLNTFLGYANAAFPLKTSKKSSTAKRYHMDPEVRHAMDTLNFIQEAYNISRGEYLKEILKKLQSVLHRSS